MNSTPQYVIEMDSKFNYPFKGPKNAAFHVQVKATLHFDADGKAHAAVSNLVTIDSPNIIKMTEVLQSYITSSYTFIYEYVPYPLTHYNENIEKSIMSESCRSLLERLFRLLLRRGVAPELSPDRFGFTEDFTLKYYLYPYFSPFTSTNIDKIGEAAKNYANQCVKMLQIYVRPHVPRRQLTDHDDYHRLRDQINSNQLKSTGRNNSSEQRDKSEISEPLPDHQEYSGKSGDKQSANFGDSFSMRDDKKNKKKRTSSFREEKTKSEFKVKKASWAEQKSTQNDSDQTVLQKRISEALIKTEMTLKKYEKIRKRSPMKKK